MTFFDEVYRGVPSWDLGRPQREIVALEETGVIIGDVLDAGCGTGENAFFLAARGHGVWGVDAPPRAVESARRKARDRGIRATFGLGDALDLGALGRSFDCVVDSGLFHPLRRRSPAVRRQPVPGTPARGQVGDARVQRSRPGEFPLPRRISQDGIRATFADRWRVEWIRPGGSRAWVSSITRA